MDRPLRCLVRRRGPGTLRVLQAADGVANKEVDDAWVTAQGAEKTARFASAETVRWLEWGARSYHDYALGLALLLFAAALARTAWVARPLAYLVGLSGFAYLVQGWVVGSEGFSRTHAILILVAWVVSAAWMIWLAVIAWRIPDPVAGHLTDQDAGSTTTSPTTPHR